MSQRNILAKEDGTIVIADFGYSRILHNKRREATTPASVIRAYRYLAPEVIAPDAAFQPTLQTDIYALAMTIVELGTGELPFREISNPNYLLNNVIQPKNCRPERENSLGHLEEECTRELWEYLEEMWHPEAKKRPRVDIVRRSVEALRERYPELVPLGQVVRVWNTWEVRTRTEEF